MADLSLNATTTTGLNTAVPNFSVQPIRLDDSTQKEFYWYNKDFAKFTGYYKKHGIVKSSVDSLNMWAFGKGWTASPQVTAILEGITGWGEDTFDSIMFNQGRVEDINGDAYAEIIRDAEGELINLKPLNPESVRQVTDEKGIIIFYDVWDGKEWKRKDTNKIFHTSGDRLGSEIHGISKIEANQWMIDARAEALEDRRRLLHRSTIRVIEVDSEDTSKYATLKTQYSEAIKKGEVLVVPKGNVGFPDVPPLNLEQYDAAIRYYDAAIMKAFGTPEVILGGSPDFTEAGAKVGFMTFEVPYSVKQRNMEQDIWNQLQLRVTFYKPPSLLSDQQKTEAANTGQTNIQPNDYTAQSGVTNAF